MGREKQIYINSILEHLVRQKVCYCVTSYNVLHGNRDRLLSALSRFTADRKTFENSATCWDVRWQSEPILWKNSLSIINYNSAKTVKKYWAQFFKRASHKQERSFCATNKLYEAIFWLCCRTTRIFAVCKGGRRLPKKVLSPHQTFYWRAIWIWSARQCKSHGFSKKRFLNYQIYRSFIHFLDSNYLNWPRLSYGQNV